MPVVGEHDSFNPPPADAKLWRYIDLAKYISMLSTDTLWFSRADMLGDPFEGSMSNANVRLRPTIYPDLPVGALAGMEDARRNVRGHVFVSCWHRSEWESAAMWRLYMSGHGLALVSDLSRLTAALGGEDNIFVGQVDYVDYDQDVIPEGNLFDAFMNKRRSFEHEREVRGVIVRFPLRPDSTAETGQVIDWTLPSPSGLGVPVNLATLIAEVKVAPDAPPWFAEVAVNVTRRYSLDYPVSQSDLAGAPVY